MVAVAVAVAVAAAAAAAAACDYVTFWWDRDSHIGLCGLKLGALCDVSCHMKVVTFKHER